MFFIAESGPVALTGVFQRGCTINEKHSSIDVVFLAELCEKRASNSVRTRRFKLDEVSRLKEDEIDELLNDICDYLKVVETKATNSSLAYAIFQSQNERGKDVSPQILAKARIHGEANDIDDVEKANEITRK